MALIRINGPLTDSQKELLQEVSNSMAAHFESQTDSVLKQYPDLSSGAAADVAYLRTRSRHTPELEARLVASHRAGKTININDWPYHEDGNYDPFTGAPL